MSLAARIRDLERLVGGTIYATYAFTQHNLAADIRRLKDRVSALEDAHRLLHGRRLIDKMIKEFLRCREAAQRDRDKADHRDFLRARGERHRKKAA